MTQEMLLDIQSDMNVIKNTMNELEKLSDEKKAEEYAENILHCKLCTRCKGRRELTRRCEQFHFLYGGYLAGFAEGKPQWHNLKKNPDDLPKNREEVLLYVKIHDKQEREVILIGYRDYGFCLGEYCKDWGCVDPVHGSRYDFVCDEEVIAWAELPKWE